MVEIIKSVDYLTMHACDCEVGAPNTIQRANDSTAEAYSVQFALTFYGNGILFEPDSLLYTSMLASLHHLASCSAPPCFCKVCCLPCSLSCTFWLLVPHRLRLRGLPPRRAHCACIASPSCSLLVCFLGLAITVAPVPSSLGQ